MKSGGGGDKYKNEPGNVIGKGASPGRGLHPGCAAGSNRCQGSATRAHINTLNLKSAGFLGQ